MNDETKIRIAKAFVALHKNDDVSRWQTSDVDENEKYLTIFSDLEYCVFGNVVHNVEYDDNGEMVIEALHAKVDISANDSKTGKACVFEWVA